jgi:Flp pilus assembly protein protease CpaA
MAKSNALVLLLLLSVVCLMPFALAEAAAGAVAAAAAACASFAQLYGSENMCGPDSGTCLSEAKLSHACAQTCMLRLAIGTVCIETRAVVGLLRTASSSDRLVGCGCCLKSVRSNPDSG